MSVSARLYLRTPCNVRGQSKAGKRKRRGNRDLFESTIDLTLFVEQSQEFLAAAAARAMTSETDLPNANATTIEDTTTDHDTTTGRSSWARSPAAGTRRGADGETENENAAGEVDRQRAAGTNAAAGEDTEEAATATSTTLAIEARPATDANGTTTATAGTKDESPRGENPRG